MITRERMKEMLNGRAVEVCRHLFPEGKTEKQHYVVGDVFGKKGQSLKIHICGAKIGWWYDFAPAKDGGGIGGKSLVSLWTAANNGDWKKTYDEIKEWLGVTDAFTERVTGVNQTKLKKGKDSLASRFSPVKKEGKVWAWLVSRGLMPDTIMAYRIGEMHVKKEGRDCVVFPFYDSGGHLVRFKVRDISDKKYMWQYPGRGDAHRYEHGYKKCMFGWQAVRDTASSIVICEGEIDAMTIHQYGYEGFSVPEGAKGLAMDGGNPNDEWLMNDHDGLEQFDTIYVMMDQDECGKAALDAIVPRLRRERVYVPMLPEGIKDANEYLMSSHDNMDNVIENAESMDPPELKRPGDISEAIWKEFYPDGGVAIGYDLPWALPFRIRLGETTLLHGYTKSGKTVGLNYVLNSCARMGARVMVASFEIPARKTFKNMMRQVMGKSKPDSESRDEFYRYLTWMDEHYFLYDMVGKAEMPIVLDAFKYATSKYGVTIFVIDSLMMCKGVSMYEPATQETVMEEIVAFSIRNNVHVFVVAHSRKPDARHPFTKYPPDPYQAAGSSNLQNMAHNTCCFWRNREKEEKMESALLDKELARRIGDDNKEAEADGEIEKLRRMEDARFLVQLQREGDGRSSSKYLYFDGGNEGSWQFHETADFVVKGMLEESNERGHLDEQADQSGIYQDDWGGGG